MKRKIFQNDTHSFTITFLIHSLKTKMMKDIKNCLLPLFFSEFLQLNDHTVYFFFFAENDDLFIATVIVLVILINMINCL